MTPERWQRVSSIFHGALERAPERRREYVNDACGADDEARREVERLLVAHDRAGRFGEVRGRSGGSLSSASPQRRDSAASSGSAGAGPEGDGSAGGSPARRLFLAATWMAAAVTAGAFGSAAWLLIQGAGTDVSLGWTGAASGASWYVSAVDPAGPAAGRLRRGDRLLTMNGVPVGDGGVSPEARNLAVADPYTLAIERDGMPREVGLVAGSAANTAQLAYFVVSLVWCGVGLFIGFARPGSALARLAATTAVAVGLVFLKVGVFRGLPLWEPLHGVLGFHFLSRFPTGEPATGIWRTALWLMYLGGGVAAAIGLYAHGAFLLGGLDATTELMRSLPWLMGLRMPLAIGVFAAAVLGMVLVLARNYRWLHREDDRRRVRWFVYAAAVGLLPQVWWAAVSVVEQLAGPPGVSRFDLLANACTVSIPLAMAYVVVKHRVLDIKVAIRRGVQYLLARRALQVVAAIPFAALTYIAVVNRDLTVSELATDTGGYLFWLALAGLTLKYRQGIQSWLDRRFFREQYDRERLMMAWLDESTHVESLGELCRLVNDTLARALHPVSTQIWYRDPREQTETAVSGAQAVCSDFPSGEPWLSWLERRGAASPVPVPDDAGLSQRDAQWLERRGIDVIVPMADSNDRLVGALLLGARKSEEPYSDGDSRFLDTVAKQAAVIRENLRLRARLNEESRVRHDVLARLDGRLPDLLKECPVCGACFDGAVEQCPSDGEALVLSLPIARTLDGRYRLDRLIARGGMGAVYEARDLRLDRLVAAKVMLSRAFGHPGALRRFRHEARASARLSHPNIVSVYDVGPLEGEGAYIVMERVPGETLRSVLDRVGILSPSEAARWFEPLLEGVAAAHAAGLVHRDLKPENVMGQTDAVGDLRVRILDFGLVKSRHPDGLLSSGTLTVEGVVMGTPDYMSPEQLLGRDVDHRSDIFAIGVMLLEALTGRRALDVDAGGALPPVEPAAAGVSVRPAALDAVLRRCLAAAPDDRPPSVTVLRRELMPLLNQAPVDPAGT